MIKRLTKSAISILPMSIKKAGWQYLSSVAMDMIASNSNSPYVELTQQHLQNARLLPNRSDLLERLPKGGIVAEVGVDQGEFSDEILVTCQPEKLHLIDVWNTERYGIQKETQVKSKFKTSIKSGVVEINKGFSTTVLPQFEDHYLDWIYIDSDHTYQTTSEELKIARDKVKSGGFICGHDYAIGNWRTHYRYGVIEAVHEFCMKYNWEIVYLTSETHQIHSFALREIGVM